MQPGQPTGLTVSDAARTAAGYVSLIAGQEMDPNPALAEKIGCRTNPESLMSEGPPWQVRKQWWVDDPPPTLVESAMARLDSLTSQGFTRQPWTRPEPEPENNRTYKNGLGYVVGAKAYTTPAGRNLFEVTALSPCANDDQR